MDGATLEATAVMAFPSLLQLSEVSVPTLRLMTVCHDCAQAYEPSFRLLQTATLTASRCAGTMTHPLVTLSSIFTRNTQTSFLLQVVAASKCQLIHMHLAGTNSVVLAALSSFFLSWESTSYRDSSARYHRT